jgi:hypothetical protein
MHDHCPLQSACWIIATYNSSVLFLHVHAVFTSPLLGQTCYLELARGFTYTLHANPPCNGDQRATPEVLKGPPMSSLHLVLTHLSLKLKMG